MDGLHPTDAAPAGPGAAGTGPVPARELVRAAAAGAGLGALVRATTPLGRGVAALGVASWIAAAALDWVELAAIAAGSLLALAAGLAFLLASRADLAVLLDLTTPRVVVGNPATTRVEAVNRAARRMLPVRLEARVGRGGVAHLHVPALAAGGRHDEVLVIPTRRRSVVPIGPVRSVQGDPLGLVRREHAWTGTQQLYVHPRTVVVSALTTGWMRDLEGATTNERSPSDIAFHTLREYELGDDRRHIHWRTTARQPDGRMMVREFVDTRRAQLGLLLSLRPADYASADEFELAVSALASLGLRAIADEQEVACVAGRRVVPSYHGASFLDALASIELGDDHLDPVAIAARARTLVGGASIVVVVTGSTTTPETVRRATERLGPMVRAVGLEAHPGAESTVRTAPGRFQLVLASLEDLPRLVLAVSGA